MFERNEWLMDVVMFVVCYGLVLLVSWLTPGGF
jgi:hypothetical protein